MAGTARGRPGPARAGHVHGGKLLDCNGTSEESVQTDQAVTVSDNGTDFTNGGEVNNDTVSFEDCGKDTDVYCYFLASQKDRLMKDRGEKNDNEKKKRSGQQKLVIVDSEILSKFANSSTRVLARWGEKKKLLNATVDKDVDEVFFVLPSKEKCTITRDKTVQGEDEEGEEDERGEGKLSVFSEEWHFTTLYSSPVSVIGDLTHHDRENPLSTTIAQSDTKTESEDIEEEKSQIPNPSSDSGKKDVESMAAIDNMTTGSVIVIISVSCIGLVFLLAFIIVAVIQHRRNESKKKETKVHSSSGSDNKLSVKASDTNTRSVNKSESGRSGDELIGRGSAPLPLSDPHGVSARSLNSKRQGWTTKEEERKPLLSSPEKKKM